MQSVDYQALGCHPPRPAFFYDNEFRRPRARKGAVWRKEPEPRPKEHRFGEVADKLLLVRCLRIILCAKSAEDYMQSIDYQALGCHPSAGLFLV